MAMAPTQQPTKENLANKAGEVYRAGMDKAEEAKDTFMTKAKDAAGNVADKASHLASNVADTTGHAAAVVGDKAQQGVAAVGGGMKSLAGTIRENSPHEGYLGSASSSVAESLESGGRYLQEQGLKGMGEDLTELIRKNPIPALLVGIGLGFLLARTTSRS
jgi:hypothetical protein